MSAFSPGPWRWQTSDREDDLPCLIDSADQVVCGFGNAAQYYPTEGVAPNAQDARLIAAAPEMFDLLNDPATNTADWAARRLALLLRVAGDLTKAVTP